MNKILRIDFKSETQFPYVMVIEEEYDENGEFVWATCFYSNNEEIPVLVDGKRINPPIKRERPTVIDLKEDGYARVQYDQYVDGGGISIRLILHGQPFGKLTTNLFPIDDLKEGEFCVKTWGENALFIDDCRPYFHNTGKRFSAGYTTGEIWRFK